MSAPPPPTIPSDLLHGWEQTDTEISRLFDLGIAHVDGHTVVYEDEQLRATIEAKTGTTDLSRLFFATRIQFVPSLPPGASQLIKPRVVREVTTAVADRFREVGFTNISTGDQKRLKTDSGSQATLIPYDAAYEWSYATVPVKGFAGVWSNNGFRIAGGAYPTAIEDIDVDVQAYQTELLELIAAVR